MATVPYDLASAAFDLNAWEGPPARSIVLCTSRRSGSTLLGEALHRAGGLGCPLEYLHRGFRPGFERRWGTSELGDYVAEMYRRRTDPDGTFAIKLFWADLLEVSSERHPDEAPALLAAAGAEVEARDRLYGRIADLVAELCPNPTFVFLWRRDLLRQSISDLRAHHSGEWRRLTEQAGTTVPELAVADITERIAVLAFQREQWRQWFASVGIAPIEVVYEDLVADYAPVCRSLAELLGGRDPDRAAAAPRLVRQSDSATEQVALRYLRAVSGQRAVGAAPAP